MSKRIFLLTVLYFSLSSVAIASGLQTGEAFPATKLKDQHGEVVGITSESRVIIFAVEKPASDLANRLLEKKPSDFLVQQQAHFIVDISNMPKMITRMFALPKMRKRPYAILLAEEAETLAFIPRRKNEVTVVRLHQGRVESVGFVASEMAFDDVF